MTYLPIGRRRSLSLAQRAATLLAELWRGWQRARISARTARQLRDCDDHLLHDVGLTRQGMADPVVWDRRP